MDTEDDLIERLAFRAERMKLQADRARRAQHEASARLDSIEHELRAMRLELDAATCPPKQATKQ